MTRTVPVLALVSVVLSLLQVPATAAQTDPPPPPTPTPTAYVRLRTAYTAWLRAEPDIRHDLDRVVLPRGTDVEVLAVVPDQSERLGGYWYQVQAFLPGRVPLEGWLHATTLYLAVPAPAAAPATAAPTGAARPPGSPSDAPGWATGTTDAAQVPTAGPMTEIPLALRVCYDLHANKTCDVDEGIAGVPVYGTDATTGEVVVTGITDATGVAQLVWSASQADAHAQLTLTVPYFQAVRTVQPAQLTLDPVLVTTLAPVPAWLP